MNAKEKRLLRWSVSLFYFFPGLAFATWASRIPEVKGNLGISEAALGTILLMMPLGQLSTMALSGRLVTKFGSPQIIKWACLLYTATLCLIPLAHDTYSLGACLFLFGIFGNMCNIAVNTQGITAEKIYEKPIMSSFHGAWSVAGFCGALIGLLTINLGIDIQKHFIIIFVLSTLNLIFFSKKLRKEEPNISQKKGFVKPDRMIIQLGILGFLCMATEGAMFDWSGVYFKEIVHAPAHLVPIGYTAFMIMMATGRFLGDWVMAKLGRKNTLQISGLMMCAGLLLAVFFPSLIVCTIAFMLVGLGVAAVIPSVYSAAGQHSSIAPGQALALVSSISFLGFLLGPPLIGYIAELLDLRYSYAIFSSFGFILWILVGQMSIFKNK